MPGARRDPRRLLCPAPARALGTRAARPAAETEPLSIRRLTLADLSQVMVIERRELYELIEHTFKRSRETYRVPRIHAELSGEHGVRLSRKRVAPTEAQARDRGRLAAWQAGH